MGEQRRVDRCLGVFSITVLAACSFDASGPGSAGNAEGGSSVSGATDATDATDATTTTDATTATTTTAATDATTTGADPTSESVGPVDTSDSGGEASCGDGDLEGDEECDDGNPDEADGCLSTCAVPRSCAHILAELPGIADGQYRIDLPSGPLGVYCDMVTDGGGWALVAKVNPTDQDTAPGAEPLGWFNMTRDIDQLASPDLVLNGPLASHGASVLLPLVGVGTLARFEVIAADDPAVAVAWYKQALAASFASWFDAGDLPTMVCSDLAMSDDCAMETIAPTGGQNSPTVLGGMDLQDFGYVGGYPVHMRLDDDQSGPELSGLCSSTEDANGNAWPDSYAMQWGNALRIWLR